MGLKLFSRRKSYAPTGPAAGPGSRVNYEPAPKVDLATDLLQKAVQCHRYGTIVQRRHEWVRHPGFQSAYAKAMEAIDDRFGLVPEGFVSIPTTLNDQPGCEEQDFETAPFLMARHTISNGEYQLFVDSGAYEDLELWPQDLWPQLIGFTDLSGQPGPRFWRQGRHDQRLVNHPVTGICFYEATAYAKWAGYRLPGEAEWQMAASWRLRSATQTGRRYPWGEALDLDHCNIWASGHAGTVPVHACPGGAAPNGVLQLIGNVWEWVDSDFVSADEQGRDIVGEQLLKCIRGGAYDTYFPWQASSVFRSALVCLARTHNVGIRCALDLPSEEDQGGAAT
jgi:iron(II)-dependent oxidoreductase